MNGILLALEGVSMALEAIRGNKVRAALTIAGVAIGVFVVVAMGAVVNGIRASFQQDLEEIGATTFIVQRRGSGINACDGTDENCPDRRNPPISFAEWDMIRRLPGVQEVIGTMAGQANFAYRNSRVDNVGYDAYSVEWPAVNASDIARDAISRVPSMRQDNRSCCSTTPSRLSCSAIPNRSASP